MERLFDELARLISEIDALKQFTKPLTDGQQERFEVWQNKVRGILVKIYGEKGEPVRKFDAIHFSPAYHFAGMGAKQENEAFQRGLTSARALLRSLLETDGVRGVAVPPPRTGGSANPKCFLSASFDSDARAVIEWFRDLAASVGFEVDWLADYAEPRPVEQKVKEHLRTSSCLIQVITKDVLDKGKEKGWVGNEIAWSDEIHGKGRQAIFAESGVKPTGIGPEITEIVTFQRDRLHEVAPKAVAYLLKLRASVQGAALDS